MFHSHIQYQVLQIAAFHAVEPSKFDAAIGHFSVAIAAAGYHTAGSPVDRKIRLGAGMVLASFRSGCNLAASSPLFPREITRFSG
jgi:hypothetical protein